LSEPQRGLESHRRCPLPIWTRCAQQQAEPDDTDESGHFDSARVLAEMQ